MAERIHKKRTYFVSEQQGISGFMREQWVYGIASGATVQRRRSLVSGQSMIGMGNLNDGKRFRLDDGHLPDYQPRATYFEASEWVHAYPGRIAWIIPQ